MDQAIDGMAEFADYQAEARYVSPGVIEFSTDVLPAWSFSSAQRAARLQRQRDIIGVLHQNGVPLLLGTDSGVRWIFPGFAIHTELEEMVRAGLTPYEALLTGTVNAARFLEAEGEFGTIEVGRRADMILLDANPLLDVANVRQRNGVMFQGVWLEAAVIDAKLEVIAQTYGN